jgi:anthranilate synthase
MPKLHYQTRGGIEISRDTQSLPYLDAGSDLIERLSQRRGAYFCSSVEYPGRYTRWDMGFIDPPLVVSAVGRRFDITALNPRGQVLLPAIHQALAASSVLSELQLDPDQVSGCVAAPAAVFAEEQRSRQNSVFSVLRCLLELFASDEDDTLGLYGAFGYDLVFQFEPLALTLERAADQRDLLLYLADDILLVDHVKQLALRHRYEFSYAGVSSVGQVRSGALSRYQNLPPVPLPEARDQSATDYQALVERARDAFVAGELFEVVLGQLFSEPCQASPSEVFRRLRHSNPAPFGALINLGQGEFLVSASPEMFVRVDGRRIETCPISGTIARGRDPLEDAEQIRSLLNSDKDASELTMCTDVDRNDKARVCDADSVRVLGRRQIELYSRLIHTVDHVEGQLRPEFDALDGFLSHAWAVTVTGAPKRRALQFIEQHERSARRWYGGAIGRITFDGNLNTGLTLRTLRLQDGMAEVRAGATLLYDSDAALEQAECQLKASAQLAAIHAPSQSGATAAVVLPGTGKRVLLIDHEDSFVHTLASYLRAAGAEVETLRPALARSRLAAGLRPDLAVLSPGPGRPQDFDLHASLSLLLLSATPVFGVCLGLQGMVEYFGGELALLSQPVHGKSSMVSRQGGRLLAGLPPRFSVGRYHSLCAVHASLPPELQVTAESDDGVVMALEHRSLPLAAVQFHPESIMTQGEGVGRALIDAVLTQLCRTPEGC